MTQPLATRYPIVLVPGLLGYVRLAWLPYWYGIVPALRQGGATVIPLTVSPMNATEVRGEQLLQRIDEILRDTGAAKVNLIGHSQGALTCRYAAARRPDRVASVTSLAGPNQGSELADFIERKWPSHTWRGRLLYGASRLVCRVLAWLDAGQRGRRLPVDVSAAHRSLTTSGVARFNQRYPQGLPTTWGGHGPERVDGVRYYSWSGTLQPGATNRGANRFDVTHLVCRILARTFVKEHGQSDGMVGRFSSHLGTVIGSDYPLDHFDIINQRLGLVGKGADPVGLFLRHAERLRDAGL